MSQLPTPSLLAANVGLRENSGSDKGVLLLIWDWDLANYPDVTFTVEYRSSLSSGAWTTATTALTSFEVTTLNLSAGYDWRVKASADGYTASAYLTGSFTTDAIPANAAAISAHGSLTAVNTGTPGSVRVSWLPTSKKYSQTYLTMAAAGETDAHALTGLLENSVVVSGLVVGKTYTITVQPIAVLVSTTYTSSNSASVTLDIYLAAPYWDGPSELYLEVGKFAAALWQLWALGTVYESTYGPAVPGLAVPDPVPIAYDPRRTYLSGAPSQEGIFRMYLSAALADVNGAVTVIEKAVTVGVTGALCVGWLNADGKKTDLQFDQRTRKVKSFAAPGTDSEASLRLTRGETRRLYILQRDNAGQVVVPDLTAMYLTVRGKNRRDGSPLVEKRVTSIVVSVIAGRSVPYMDVTVGASPILDVIFDGLNANPIGEPLATALEAEGELVLVPTVGNAVTSEPFPVWIEQDVER